METKFEEVLPSAREGLAIMNLDWNGLRHPDGTIMYVMIQKPDEHSKNTEPYFMMHIGKCVGKNPKNPDGYKFQRFPWLPSAKDLFSEKWMVREWQDEYQGPKKEE